MRVLDLFSGIGGFSLGLERAGMETVAFCEIEDYPREVLKKHWPKVPCYKDVREVTGDRLKKDGIAVDVITGGFPCQDISVAGNQAGIGEGTRSGLWSEVARLIDEIQPRYAIMENVTALISGDSGRWFGRVLGDLAEIGYDAEWHCIPASELGAHHHRDRIWIVAYPNKSNGRQGSGRKSGSQKSSSLRKNVPNPDSDRLQRSAISGGSEKAGPGIIERSQITRAYSENRGDRGVWSIEPGICRVANGVPSRVDRIKCLGNAVVPQIPEIIGHAIMATEKVS